MNETQCSDQPAVIVITGLPCTGKTTIGKRIASQLNIPFLHKDGFKEVLFDCLGAGDRAWSSCLSKASFELLFHSVEVNIACGRSVIIEGNFRENEHSEQLNRLATVYRCKLCQLHCVADGEVLLERFRQRVCSSARHAGHIDSTLEIELKQTLLEGRDNPLRLNAGIIELNTTQFDEVDAISLAQQCIQYCQS